VYKTEQVTATLLLLQLSEPAWMVRPTGSVTRKRTEYAEAVDEPAGKRKVLDKKKNNNSRMAIR
jgi:hypothetical protein